LKAASIESQYSREAKAERSRCGRQYLRSAICATRSKGPSGPARPDTDPSWENARAAGRYQPLKFLSSHPRVPDHGRDRALDGGCQEVRPLRPSGRDYDPDRLSPRLAGVRVVRSAMVAG